jgi:metal-responsive CopG/Arc/MetJ family transcriptional regulator
MTRMDNQRIIVTLRDDYVQALDTMVQRGVAPSRNALIQRIVAGFLLMVGLGVIANILSE